MNRPTGKVAEVRKRRVALEGAVKIVPRSDDAPEVLKYVDLSMGGLFVKSEQPLQVGTTFDLELRLIRLPFKTSATVAWIRPYETRPEKPAGMGLEFQELSSVQKRGLYLQIGEALEGGSDAKPGTPPTREELAARARAQETAAPKKGSFWTRLISSH